MRAVIFCLLAIVAAPAFSQELRVGAASESITPPIGIPMAGYYSERGARGIHDELYAKAIVLETGGATAALVALDLITTPRDLVDEARHQIERVAGIPGSSVMISATHSHTGPVLDLSSPFGGQSDLVKRYRASLPGKIAEAVRRSRSRLTPARALSAHGRESSIAFNRRFHMKDGTVGWNPGKKNPNILKPAGPIDADVPLVLFESMDRKPLAAYVNYAVHLDNVGEPLISADMPATLSRCLAEYGGPELVTVFTAGCCGDVNHIDVHWAQAQSGFANPARMGTILAAEVFRSWPRLQPVALGALRVRSEVVRLALAELAPGDADKAQSIMARVADQKPPRPGFMETVQAFKVRDVIAREGRPLEVEVQVIALGNDIAWVSLPGEIFTELGLAIKEDSTFPHTIVAELANGSIGYIPSRRAYTQGNYEVVSARCAPGSGERLVDAAVKLLTDLHVEKTGGNEK
jgi:neutral ceramidase